MALEYYFTFQANYNPGFPVDYTFLDEDYQRQYVSEQRVSALSAYFAGLAIVISAWDCSDWPPSQRKG